MNARLLVDTIRGAVVVPTVSIQRSPDATFVYVVKPDSTVEMRTVQVRLTDGDSTAIQSGLSAGDMVVDRRRGQAPAGHDRVAPRRGRRGAKGGRVNPSRLFILRPVATSLLMAGILLAGIVAYRQLPVSALPQVDYPTIQMRDVLSRREPGRDAPRPSRRRWSGSSASCRG